MRCTIAVLVLFGAGGFSMRSAAKADHRISKTNPRDGLTYIWIPAGSFTMGCSAADRECWSWEAAPHRVTIEKDFWIGRTEVTQRAYLHVVGKNPSRYRGPDLPVDQVSWTAAKQYCTTVGMRLPTESEWEYAARAGSEMSRYGPLESVGWFDGNSQDRTHPVGTKAPNAFGLYDLLGNVWEWVEDAYSANPKMRTLCGGSFYNPARDLRPSNRLWANPELAHRDMGFRCAAN